MRNLVLKQIHWALFWSQFLPMKPTSSRLQIRCLQKPGRRVEEWVCQVGQWWAGKPPAAVAVGRWPLPPQQRFKKHPWVIKTDLWTIMSLWVSDVLSWTCTGEKFGETYENVGKTLVLWNKLQITLQSFSPALWGCSWRRVWLPSFFLLGCHWWVGDWEAMELFCCPKAPGH